MQGLKICVHGLDINSIYDGRYLSGINIDKLRARLRAKSKSAN